MSVAKQNLQRETLRKYANTKQASTVAKQLIPLRIEYSEKSKLLTGYLNKLVGVTRIYPRHLPTQASFRWSTIDPPITNWPRACVNVSCLQGEHEWTDNCWSVRDILLPDSDEILVSWDHDNIEGRIHDLIVQDEEAISAHTKGYDLHTITCCNIFSMDLPQDLRNPHTSTLDEAWRRKYKWQGKDTKQRVLAKNFNHGSKYSPTWRFVYLIQGIEKYGVSREHLAKLAQRYIASKEDAWARKLSIMQSIQMDRCARTLYGGRRIFYDGSEETGKEGFSHMISGTVSDYNNETLILLEAWLNKNTRLLHNAHDGDKITINKDIMRFTGMNVVNIPNGQYNKEELLKKLKQIIERPITYQGRTLTLTAGVKIHV